MDGEKTIEKTKEVVHDGNLAATIMVYHERFYTHGYSDVYGGQVRILNGTNEWSMPMVFCSRFFHSESSPVRKKQCARPCCSRDEQSFIKTINNSSHSKTFKVKQQIRWNGEKMAKRKGCWKNRLSVPKTLYNELVEAAREKHQTLKEYIDELSIFLLFGEFEL